VTDLGPEPVSAVPPFGAPVAARRQASDAAQIRLFCGSLGPFYEPTSAVGFSWTWTAGVLAGDLVAV